MCTRYKHIAQMRPAGLFQSHTLVLDEIGYLEAADTKVINRRHRSVPAGEEKGEEETRLGDDLRHWMFTSNRSDRNVF